MTKTIGAQIAEALGLDPSKISPRNGIVINVDNHAAYVEVTYNAKLIFENETELTTALKRYRLEPADYVSPSVNYVSPPD
jgi:hypothetical protein